MLQVTSKCCIAAAGSGLGGEGVKGAPQYACRQVAVDQVASSNFRIRYGRQKPFYCDQGEPRLAEKWPSSLVRLYLVESILCVLQLYRDCLRLADYIGTKVHTLLHEMYSWDVPPVS